MKKKKSIWIVILFAMLVLVTAGYFLCKGVEDKKATPPQVNSIVPSKPKLEYVKVDKEGIRTNISEKFAKERKLENFVVKKKLFASKADKTELALDVTNTSAEKSKLATVVVTLLDKEGKEIVKLNGIVNEVNPGETTMVYISSSLDYTHAVDYKIEIVK